MALITTTTHPTQSQGQAVNYASSQSVWNVLGTLNIAQAATLTGTKHTAKSRIFNIDNGAGTTIDDVIIKSAQAIQITAIRIVYVTETTGTVAGANVKLGTALGGSEIAAATAYENTKAVGTSTAVTIADGAVAAAGAVFVRHTGIATTAAGEAFVEIDYVLA